MEPMSRTAQGELCWTDLVAVDLEAQTTFYEALWGWTHTDLPTDMGPIYRMFYREGLNVAGGSQISPDMQAAGVPAMWNVYFAARDVDDIAARAVDLGGSIAMPAMDVMNQGRMVGIADPTGGAVFFWQAGTHPGAQLFSAPGSLMWADFSSSDPAAAAGFFKELLGWEIDELSAMGMPYWQVSAAGTPEAGIMPMPPGVPEGVPSNWLPYFGTVDVRATVELAVRLGATVEAPVMEASGVTFAVLSDPAGATFSVMEPMPG